MVQAQRFHKKKHIGNGSSVCDSFRGRVAEPEPAGAETFGWSRSRYTEVSAPAPGQIKLVYLIIIHIE